jgi:hypothetical protein
MTHTIDNTQDVIDSRDVIERIAHLEQLEQPGAVDLGADDNEQAQDDLFAELKALRALADEASGYAADWQYGEALIRDSYFKEYAQQLADDIGAVKAASWPNNCIDWDEAARQLQQDYTEVDFDGVAYWIR